MRYRQTGYTLVFLTSWAYFLLSGSDVSLGCAALSTIVMLIELVRPVFRPTDNRLEKQELE